MTAAWTGHGGRLAEARAVFGDPARWIDLSTGINPNAWPGADMVEIDWRRLPDEAALRDLECAAAEHFGADPAHVAALPGTESGLRLLGTLLPGSAQHHWPSYRTHAEVFAGSEPCREAVLDPRGHVVLANPNNPDGRQMSAPALLELLDRLRTAGSWLVVDEAFADSAPDHSLAAQVREGVPLVVFRSFGKFFGLAGLRLGFVLGPSSIVAAFRQRLGSWPVSSAAIAIGAAAYRDADWIAATRRDLVRRRAALDAVLGGHGLAVLGDCPLFRLVEAGDAAALFQRLAHQAILTRPFDYDPRWLRFGLPGDAAELARLDRALANG